jgi:hypothetical protein
MDIDASQEIWKFVSKYDINGLINCGSTDITTSNDVEFEIFPNPSSNFITIKSTNKTNLKFSVFSTFGKLVINGELDNINDIIDLSELDPQLYILKIDGSSYKIIKE